MYPDAQGPDKESLRILSCKNEIKEQKIMDYTEALNELDIEARRLGERL